VAVRYGEDMVKTHSSSRDFFYLMTEIFSSSSWMMYICLLVTVYACVSIGSSGRNTNIIFFLMALMAHQLEIIKITILGFTVFPLQVLGRLIALILKQCDCISSCDHQRSSPCIFLFPISFLVKTPVIWGQSMNGYRKFIQWLWIQGLNSCFWNSFLRDCYFELVWCVEYRHYAMQVSLITVCCSIGLAKFVEGWYSAWEACKGSFRSV